MTKPVIVRWGGGLAGFAPNPDPAAPEPPELAERAAELVRTLIGQPHTESVNFRELPVWGFLRDRTMWCFTVQGRGGGFGRAGACEFLFLPGDWHPARAWWTGLTKIGADGRITPSGDRPAVLDVPARPAVLAALTGLAAGRRKLALDGEPHEVAAVITALLTVLPVAVAAERFWVTYPVKPPQEARLVATGRWPAELARERDADRLLAWLEDEDEDEPLPDKQRKAIEWIADQALENQDPWGPVLERYRDTPSMREFVDAVVRDELDIDVEDVPQLLRHNPERLLRGSGPKVARTWALYRPAEAIKKLLHGQNDVTLRKLLFDGVLEADATAGPGQNPALFPPAPEGSLHGWHDVLADLLRRKYPAKPDLVWFVQEILCAPGRQLEQTESRAQAAGWFRRLGLTAEDPGTEGLFPIQFSDIAAELKSRGRLSEPHRRRLAAATDPVAELRKLLAHLPRPEPAAAVAMLQVVPEESARRTLLSEMLDTMDRYDDVVSQWLTTVVRTWPERDTDFIVLVGAGFLTNPRTVDSSFLHEMLRMVAATQPTGLRGLLGEAGRRLGSDGQAAPAYQSPAYVGAGYENPVQDRIDERYSFPGKRRRSSLRQRGGSRWRRRARVVPGPKLQKPDGDPWAAGERSSDEVAPVELDSYRSDGDARTSAFRERLPVVVVSFLLLVTAVAAILIVVELLS